MIRRTAPLDNRRGFTLVELLVVLAVIALLASLTVPALQGVIGSNNLKAGANSTVGELDLARQYASTRNLPVEVRLYADSSKPRDVNGNYPYRLMSVVIPASVSNAASDEFLTQVLPLPGDVIIDSSTQQSSVLNVALGSAGLQPVAATEIASAPAIVRNLPYIKFTYLANGTINLDPAQQWCLTLYNQSKSHLAGAHGSPTANFVTIVFDVQTARSRIYQP